MPGIAEFLAEGPEQLIIAELGNGDVLLTIVNTITHERHSITMRHTEAHAAGLILRFAARSLRISPTGTPPPPFGFSERQ
jgi:hypothetical protein